MHTRHVTSGLVLAIAFGASACKSTGPTSSLREVDVGPDASAGDPVQGKTYSGPGLSSITFTDATSFSVASEGGAYSGVYSVGGGSVLLTPSDGSAPYTMTLSPDGSQLTASSGTVYTSSSTSAGPSIVQGKVYSGPGLTSITFTDGATFSVTSEGGGYSGTYSVDGNAVRLVPSNGSAPYTMTLSSDASQLTASNGSVYAAGVPSAVASPVQGKTFSGPGLSSITFTDDTTFSVASEGGAYAGTYHVAGGSVQLTPSNGSAAYTMTLSSDGSRLTASNGVIYSASH